MQYALCWKTTLVHHIPCDQVSKLVGLFKSACKHTHNTLSTCTGTLSLATRQEYRLILVHVHKRTITWEKLFIKYKRIYSPLHHFLQRSLINRFTQSLNANTHQSVNLAIWGLEAGTVPLTCMVVTGSVLHKYKCVADILDTRSIAWSLSFSWGCGVPSCTALQVTQQYMHTGKNRHEQEVLKSQTTMDKTD